MKVKICGLQPTDNLDFVRHQLIEYVGAIFVPQSKRFISAQAGRIIHDQIAGRCKMMGIFVNSLPENVMFMLDTSGANGAQLHGDESPEFCQQIRSAGFEVWKYISVSSSLSAADIAIRIEAYQDSVDAILLDASVPKGSTPNVTGGLGQQFNWTILPDVFAERTKRHIEIPIWVAGGINPENVTELLAIAKPAGIDLSSGVEVDGRKAIDRIEALLKAVESHD